MKSLSFSTKVFTNGKDALEQTIKNYWEVGILLTDKQMPEMNGPEVAKNI